MKESVWSFPFAWSGFARAPRRAALMGVALAVALTVVHDGVARTPVPPVLTEQGRLMTPEGTPVEGDLEFVFALYNSPTSRSNLWLERTLVSVDNGYFSVRLGEDTPFPADLFATEGNLYLGIRIGDDEELKPRQKITSVPFALRAAYADEAASATGALAQQIVPSGAVMAFDLDACPEGWSAFAPARGRTIVGANLVDPDQAGTGDKLSRRTRGELFGAESHTLTVDELPPHHHTGATDRGARMTYRVFYSVGENYGANRSTGFGGGVYTERSDTSWPMSDHTHTFTTNDTGEGQSISLMQPSMVLLYCRKS